MNGRLNKGCFSNIDSFTNAKYGSSLPSIYKWQRIFNKVTCTSFRASVQSTDVIGGALVSFIVTLGQVVLNEDEGGERGHTRCPIVRQRVAHETAGNAVSAVGRRRQHVRPTCICHRLPFHNIDLATGNSRTTTLPSWWLPAICSSRLSGPAVHCAR